MAYTRSAEAASGFAVPDTPPVLREPLPPSGLRRHRRFSASCAFRLVSIALADRCSPAGSRRERRRVVQPDGAQARALSGQGEERHLPVHGRRTAPAGAVRLQAKAPGIERPADPGLVHRGQAVRFHGHQPRHEAARHAPRNSRSTASRARGSRKCCRTRRPSWTTSSFVTSCATNVFNHAPAKLFMNTGSRPVRPAQHGRVGDVRHRQRIGRSAGLRRAAVRSARPARRFASTGRSGFLPTTYQGVPLPGSGDPILNLTSPPGISTPAPARYAIDAIRDLNLQAARRNRRPGDRHAHRRLRDGVPDANPAPRS